MSSTRSGKAYSPFAAIPLACSPAFAIAPLLQQALLLDHDGYYEVSGHEAGHGAGDKRSAVEAFGQQPTSSNEPTESISTSTLDAIQPKKKRNRKHDHRQKKRDKKIRAEGQTQRPCVTLGHAREETAIPVDIVLQKLPTSSCGYTAKVKGSSSKKVMGLEEAIAAGYRLIEWDGRTAIPLVDHKTNKIFAVCVGRPDDSSYDETCRAAFEAIYSTGQSADFSLNEKIHRRGAFPALNVGISYGHGPKQPHNLKNGPHKEMLQSLLSNKSVIRLATFASASFNLWAPRVYEYYRKRLNSLYSRMPELRQNFEKSVFSCAAFNFGPQVCTLPHRDCMNCPFGWCAIQALGNFDPTRGGHLVLADLKILIQFPLGSLVLIPSATLKHANIPVQRGELRISFTQFCVGGLFRYVDNGFRTEAAFKSEDESGYLKMIEEKATRWVMGLGLWDTIEGLREGAKPAPVLPKALST